MRAQDFLSQELNEDLRKWFKEKWVRFGPDGKIRGDCARGDDSEGKPKCLPQSKAHALGKKGRASAAARKRREDPNPERRGPARNVATKKKSNEALVREDHNLSDAQVIAAQIRDHMDEYYNLQRSGRKDGDTLAAINMSKRSVAALNQELQQLGYKYAPTVTGLVALKGTPFVEEGAEQCPECGGAMFSDLLLAEKKDACYNKVRSRYKVWPSAYASGALVQCRKKGAANWGNKSEGVAEGEKKPHPETWHDVDKKLGRAVDKMSQAEKVKKGLAHPDTLKKQGVAEGSTEQVYKVLAVDKSNALSKQVKLKVKASSLDEVFERLAINDWYPLEINGVEVINGKRLKQGVAEMDKSQPSHGRDGKISHSTYGSRDRGGSTGQERTAKMTTADKMMKDAHDAMMKSMSDADKVKKGWRNPNLKEQGVAEANPNQQVSRWHPETSTYRGSMNKIPTSTSVDVDDITARGQQVDFPTHRELARNANIENPEDVVYKNDLKKLVQQHFKSLPNNIREVLKMRFWDGMTLEQTAKRLGVSAAHVRQLEAKGFRMLAHSSRLGQVYEADQLDERCWDTHRQVGMKKKGDRMVPNCVPKEDAPSKSAIGEAIAQVRR